jgi:uncharacterized protein (TIGR03435 family)
MRGVKLSRAGALAGVVGLLFGLSGTLYAQAILGTWQGTLPSSPESQRIVLKIEKADDSSLRGVLYRIDKSAEGMILTAISFQLPDVSVEETFIDVSYKGKLSADGNSIDGIWTEDKKSNAITFVRATPATVWKHDGAAPLRAMSRTADPAFEVATIKPSQPDGKQGGFDLRSRHFEADHSTVIDLIKFAYNVRFRQISGATVSWLNEAKFDIAAEPDTEGLPSRDQDRLMLKKLLADRFHLSVHSVQQIFPVYALTIKKGHPKFTVSAPEFNRGSIYVKGVSDEETLVQFASHSMPMFADVLMDFIRDRQIVDETGLTGTYDFAITIPSSVLKGSLDDNEKATAFIGALEPLGFKLVPKKAMLEVIVIDHLEKPSAN